MKNSEKRLKQISRMVDILGLLNKENRGYSRQELAEKFEVDIRSISRDISTLAKEFPLHCDSETRKYRFSDGYSFKDIDLSQEEIRALLMCRLIASNLGEPVSGPIDSLMMKLKVDLGKKSSEMFDKVSATYSFDIEPTERITALQKWFDVIQHALDDNLSLEITHRQVALKEVETIDPYGFFTRGGIFYLVGYSHEKREISLYAIHRIRNVRLTDISYRIPSEFSINEFLKDRKEVVYRDDIEGLNLALEWLEATIGLFEARRFVWMLTIFAKNYQETITGVRQAIAIAVNEINRTQPDSYKFENESVVIKSVEEVLRQQERMKKAFQNTIQKSPLESYDKSIHGQFVKLEEMNFNRETREFLKAFDEVTLKKKRDKIKEELERIKAMTYGEADSRGNKPI